MKIELLLLLLLLLYYVHYIPHFVTLTDHLEKKNNLIIFHRQKLPRRNTMSSAGLLPVAKSQIITKNYMNHSQPTVSSDMQIWLL